MTRLTHATSERAPVRVAVLLGIGEAPAGLARAALRNGWLIVPGGVLDARRVHAVSAGSRPACLVHVCRGSAEAIEAIAALRQARWCAGVIAVGDASVPTLEVASRAAGAACFLDESGSPESFERAVEQVLGRGFVGRGGAAAGRKTG